MSSFRWLFCVQHIVCVFSPCSCFVRVVQVVFCMFNVVLYFSACFKWWFVKVVFSEAYFHFHAYNCVLSLPLHVSPPVVFYVCQSGKVSVFLAYHDVVYSSMYLSVMTYPCGCFKCVMCCLPRVPSPGVHWYRVMCFAYFL